MIQFCHKEITYKSPGTITEGNTLIQFLGSLWPLLFADVTQRTEFHRAATAEALSMVGNGAPGVY